MNINKVSIKHTNLPSNIDKFSEDFTRILISLLIDYYPR